MTPVKGTAAALKEEFHDLWVDESVFPAIIPEVTEDIMRAVNWCRENGWSVFPVGLGTSFGDSHSVTTGVLTIISLSRDGISEPDPLDLAIEVEAGVTSKDFKSYVESSGFKLDGWPESYPGTVGGLICGLRGPELKHLILGADIIDGRGRSLRFGGRVRKNVSGFDVSGLLAGSRGRMAWIDRLYVKLTPGGAPDIGTLPKSYRVTGREPSEIEQRVFQSLDPDDVFLKNNL